MTILERNLVQNADGTLAVDASLRTVIECALLTHGRASAEDGLRDSADLGGWWGDAYPDVQGRRVGSRLWTLAGRPVRLALDLAPQMAQEALAFLVEDGMADRVEVEVAQAGPTAIALQIGVVEPGQKLVKWIDSWQIQVG